MVNMIFTRKGKPVEKTYTLIGNFNPSQSHTGMLSNGICNICEKRIWWYQKEFYDSIFASDQYPVVHWKCDEEKSASLTSKEKVE